MSKKFNFLDLNTVFGYVLLFKYNNNKSIALRNGKLYQTKADAEMALSQIDDSVGYEIGIVTNKNLKQLLKSDYMLGVYVGFLSIKHGVLTKQYVYSRYGLKNMLAYLKKDYQKLAVTIEPINKIEPMSENNKA